MKINIKDAYYEWLCYIVEVNQADRSYYLLLKDLHRISFRWFVPNDDNRSFEGKNLRERFCEEEDIDFDDAHFDDEVTMLEVVLALAFRCDGIMADRSDNVKISEWFWMLLTNVGLDKFTDDEYICLGGSAMVGRIVDRILNRTYHRSGRGGLFPLKRSGKDQKKVELWYQMSEYLVENYYANG